MELFFSAIRFRQLDLVVKLGKALNINYCHPIYSYPLFYAVRFSSFQVIYNLLSLGAKINVVDKHGNGILHYTTRPEVAILFDINPNLENNIGNTPLHNMVLCGNSKMVKYLLTKNVICKKNQNGKTPLHLAVENEEIEIVKQFLDYNHFDWNEQDWDGNSCLHLAIQTKNYHIVQLLFDSCHKLVKNNHGKTPLDLIPDLKLDFSLVQIITLFVPYFEFYHEEFQKIMIDICFLFFYKDGHHEELVQKLNQVKVYSLVREKYLEESKNNKNDSDKKYYQKHP